MCKVLSRFFFLFYFFFACGRLVVPAPFVEKTIFAPLTCLCSFVKGQLTVLVGSVPGSLFCPTDRFVCFVSSTTVSWSPQLHSQSWRRAVSAPLLCWLFWLYLHNFMIPILQIEAGTEMQKNDLTVSCHPADNSPVCTDSLFRSGQDSFCIKTSPMQMWVWHKVPPVNDHQLPQVTHVTFSATLQWSRQKLSWPYFQEYRMF